MHDSVFSVCYNITRKLSGFQKISVGFRWVSGKVIFEKASIGKSVFLTPTYLPRTCNLKKKMLREKIKFPKNELQIYDLFPHGGEIVYSLTVRRRAVLPHYRHCVCYHYYQFHSRFLHIRIGYYCGNYVGFDLVEYLSKSYRFAHKFC